MLTLLPCHDQKNPVEHWKKNTETDGWKEYRCVNVWDSSCAVCQCPLSRVRPVWGAEGRSSTRRPQLPWGSPIHVTYNVHWHWGLGGGAVGERGMNTQLLWVKHLPRGTGPASSSRELSTLLTGPLRVCDRSSSSVCTGGGVPALGMPSFKPSEARELFYGAQTATLGIVVSCAGSQSATARGRKGPPVLPWGGRRLGKARIYREICKY